MIYYKLPSLFSFKTLSAYHGGKFIEEMTRDHNWRLWKGQFSLHISWPQFQQLEHVRQQNEVDSRLLPRHLTTCSPSLSGLLGASYCSSSARFYRQVCYALQYEAGVGVVGTPRSLLFAVCGRQSICLEPKGIEAGDWYKLL